MSHQCSSHWSSTVLGLNIIKFFAFMCIDVSEYLRVYGFHHYFAKAATVNFKLKQYVLQCKALGCFKIQIYFILAGPCRAFSGTTDSRASDPGFDTWSGHICFSFCWFKKGSCQLLVKVCTWSTGKLHRWSKPAQEHCGKVNLLSWHDVSCLPWK